MSRNSFDIPGTGSAGFLNHLDYGDMKASCLGECPVDRVLNRATATEDASANSRPPPRLN